MMKAKYYLRGMGIGVFVTALIFGIALVFYKPKMSEEEIRREAAKLGMVNAVDEALLSAEGADASDAEQTGTGEKVTVENIPGAPAPEEETADGTAAEETEAAAGNALNTEDSEAQDDKKAEAGQDTDAAAEDTDATKPSMEYQGEQKNEERTGGAAPGSGTASSSTSGSSSSGSGTASSSTSTSSSPGSTSANSSASQRSSGTASGSTSGASKTVTIRTGENSYTTAAHLYKDGLVDNAKKFNNYLESNHYDVRIQAGTFTIPEGASYDEIVKIITRQ